MNTWTMTKNIMKSQIMKKVEELEREIEMLSNKDEKDLKKMVNIEVEILKIKKAYKTLKEYDLI